MGFFFVLQQDIFKSPIDWIPPKKVGFRNFEFLTPGVRIAPSMNPLNRLIKVNITESKIGYRSTLHNFCCLLWRLAITFPGKIFNFYNNNVSGAFT